MNIRKEFESDQNDITQLTIAAFEHHPFSRQTEHFIINALRGSEALALSLVAEIDGRAVGHIAFSRIEISDGTSDWYGLGPVSVLPDQQRKGIGKALMAEGLSMVKKLGAKGCALVGPPDYYSKFGFKNVPKLTHEGIPQEYFLVLPFESYVPEGFVTFHKAFMAES